MSTENALGGRGNKHISCSNLWLTNQASETICTIVNGANISLLIYFRNDDCRSSFAIEMSGIICFTKMLLKNLGKVVYEDEHPLGRRVGNVQYF